MLFRFSTKLKRVFKLLVWLQTRVLFIFKYLQYMHAYMLWSFLIFTHAIILSISKTKLVLILHFQQIMGARFFKKFSFLFNFLFVFFLY